jgi:hypothetical protein
VGSRLFKLRARLGSRCRLGKPRRNRLTPRPSGRLRRRLTQALVGSSCGLSYGVFRPASRWLAVRRRSGISRSVTASPQPSELVVCGGRLLVVLRSSRPTASLKRTSSQPSNFSFKRTAAPPLNSSVRRQSIFPAWFLARFTSRFRAGKAAFAVPGWPALLSFARLVAVASCARWRTSHLRTLSCARFAAVWCLSSAVRSSCAGHKFRGIAGHSKQRYRAGWRRGLRAAV